MRSTFSDHVVVELRHAKHYYIREDVPYEITGAILKRFG